MFAYLRRGTHLNTAARLRRLIVALAVVTCGVLGWAGAVPAASARRRTPAGPGTMTVRARPDMPGGRTASLIRMLAPAPEQPISAATRRHTPKGRQAAQICGSAGGYQTLRYRLPHSSTSHGQ